MAATPSGKYDPTITASESLSCFLATGRTSRQLSNKITVQKSGSGRSRFEAYHSAFFSKKTIWCPRAWKARSRARNVVP